MKLKDVANIRTGLPLFRKKSAPYQSNISYKQLTLKSFSKSIKVNPSTLDDFLSIDEINENYLTKEGDVVVRLRKPSTAVYIDKINQGAIISSLMTVIRLNNANIDNKFLAHYLNSSTVQKVFSIASEGTTIPMIGIKDIMALDIVFPPLEQQHKIVETMNLLYQQQDILEEMQSKKKIYTQGVLNTIIQQLQGEKL